MNYSIVICLFLLTCSGITNGQDKSKIPGVLLRDINGKMINSTEVIQEGEAAIICFWASWCHPCIKELSAIAEVYEEWQNETGIILYAISVDDSRSFSNARVMINNNHGPSILF
jgi:thiol-disulfide isomerase/thioredoxin